MDKPDFFQLYLFVLDILIQVDHRLVNNLVMQQILLPEKLN